MNSAETIKLFEKYVIPNYARYPVSLVRGDGSWVWDSEGNRYLDFFPGWGCNLLGHCPGAGRRSGPRATGQADPRAQHLVHRGARAVGPGAFRAEFRRPGLLLQLRHRGQRGGDQARPAAQAQTEVQDHHLRRRLPRPHPGLTIGHRAAQVPRGIGAAAGRLRLCALRRFGGRGPLDRRARRPRS